MILLVQLVILSFNQVDAGDNDDNGDHSLGNRVGDKTNQFSRFVGQIQGRNDIPESAKTASTKH